jgi:hypothetical protein
MKRGSSKHISVVKWVVSQSWGTSNGTFVTDRVGNIEISFVEYLASKKVHLCVCVNLASTASGLCDDGVSTHTPVLQTLLGAAVNKDLELPQ